MKKLIFLLSILIFSSIFISFVSAKVNCTACTQNSCTCKIDDCSSGLLNFYQGVGCAGVPSSSKTFDSKLFSWVPSASGNNSLQALCSDSTISACYTIYATPSVNLTENASAKTTITSTIQKTTSITVSSTVTQTETKEIVKQDPLLIFGIVGLVIAFIVILALTVFKKKPGERKPESKKESSKSGTTFEDLYKKWGRR